MPASSASSPLDSALPPAPAGPLRLALVEDDATIRELLHRYLSACPEFDCFVAADSIATLRRELALSRPPQLLLDLSLPGESSLAALPTLLAEFPGLRVLVQTAHDATDILFQALRLGARGFVVKSATPLPAYRQALLDVAAGGAVMSPSVARKMLEYFTAVNSQRVPRLSYRERQVLDNLVTGHTEKQVTEHLQLSSETVRTCVVRLYEKLQAVA